MPEPPPEVIAVAIALGVLEPDGRLNDDFFARPLHELQDTLRPRARRQQALEAIDALLPEDPLLLGADMLQGDGTRKSVHPLLPRLERGQVSLTLTRRQEVAHLDVVVGLAGEYRAADGTRLAVEMPLVRARDDDLVAIAGTADGPLVVEFLQPLGDDDSATIRALVTAEGGRLVVDLHGVDLGTGPLDDLEVDTAELGADAVAAVVALIRALLADLDPGDDEAVRALIDHLPGALGLGSDGAALPLVALARDRHAFRAWLAAQIPAEGDVPGLRAWLTDVTGLLGLDVTIPAARPTPAAPWVIPLSATAPQLELTVALASRTSSGQPSLRIGVRLRAGDAGSPASLSLEATLIDLPLGGEQAAVTLPHATVVVASPPVAGAGPLVDEASVRIAALRAGLSWDGQQLRPLLELDDVRLPDAPPFERLDLSSADTLATTAHEVLDQALADALGETALARPLLVLAGLDHALDHRVDPRALAMEPLSALRRFHRETLERSEGWTPQLAALGELLGADADPTGAGTTDDPWAIQVDPLSSTRITARLLAWDATPSGPTRSLRIGLGLDGSAGEPEWSARWRAVLLAADLHPSGPADLRLLGEQHLQAHVAVPPADGLDISADTVALDARWRPGSTLTANATLTGVRIGELSLDEVALPGAFDATAPDLGLGVHPERAWAGIRTLLARAASTHGSVPGAAIAALLGLYGGGIPELPDDWPSLRLPDAGDVRSVLDDVAALARERIALLADGAEGLGESGEPYALAGLRLVGSLLGDNPTPEPAGSRAATPSGAGSPDAPWSLPIADGDARGLVWLEPDGPPPAWARAAGAALDGDLDEALAAGARWLPGVRDAFVGRGTDAVRAVDRLAAALDGTDGLLPPEAARPDVPAWRSGTDVTAAHHLLPRAEGAVTQVKEEIDARVVGLDPDDWAVILAGPSFVPAGVWDALLAALTDAEPEVVDLAASPDPELADLGALPVATFYDVRVRDDGETDVEVQLTRVAEGIRELRPGCRLVVVAHSTAGPPAARYVADHGDGVLGLVTLGSPLASVPAGPLEDPELAEALRTVRALLPLLGVTELDDALAFLDDALEGFTAAGDGQQELVVPADSFTDVPELPDLGDTPALAIAATLPGVLAETVERALAEALEALPDAAEPRRPTHLASGLEAALELPGSDGEVRVELDGAVELGATALTPDAPARTPRLRVRARIVREGGALLDGRLSEAGRDVAARVRWAELVVDEAGFTVRMHEASLHGVRRGMAGLDDAVGRQLFALLVEELDHHAADAPRLRALLDLLTDDLALLHRDAQERLTVAADAVDALRSDAPAWLAAHLPQLLDRDSGFLGLIRDPIAVAGQGPWRRALAPLPLELEVRREPWTVAVRTTGAGLPLGAEARLAGTARLPLDGDDPELDASLRLGGLTIDRATGETTVAVDGVLEATVIGPDARTALTGSLAHLAGSAVLTTLLEHLLPVRVREHLGDVPALLLDPGGVLHSRLYVADDPTVVRALLAEAAAAFGLPLDDDGTVELPGGLRLAATSLGDRLRLGVATPADGLVVENAATLHLDAAVAIDRARGAEPTAEVALDVDLPGAWDAATLVATMQGEGVRIAVRPDEGGEITLVPAFSGWHAVVGDAAERLLAQVLDASAAALPDSPLRSAALEVAQALGVFDSSFGDGAVPLSALSTETIADRAGETAEAATMLLDRAIAATLPEDAITAEGPAIRLQVPDIQDGTLSLAAELDVPAFSLELSGLAAGPTEGDARLRWTTAVTGDLDLHLDLGRALGFSLTPRLSVQIREADALSVALLPLGDDSAERARIELAPVPGVTLTEAGRGELARTWLVPPAAQVLLDAAAARLDRPVFPEGPTARTLLQATGTLAEDGTLHIPVPAPLDLLAGVGTWLADELAEELQLPLGLDGVALALAGTSADGVGVVLRGDVVLPAAGLEVHLLFGDGLGMELLTREDEGWALRPRLRLAGVGGGLSGAGGERLLDTSAVTLGALQARASTVVELAPGDGGFAAAEWSTELDLREIGLPPLTGAVGNDPVPRSLLQAVERDRGDAGDAEPLAPPIDLLVRFDDDGLELLVAGAEPGRPRWFEIERTFGPLHIEQIGVHTGKAQFPAEAELDYVGVLLGASVSVGGLTVAADGLEVRIPPKYVGSPRQWALDLAGLGLSYRQSGLALEGELTRSPDGEEYRGALHAQVAERGFAGIGAYRRPRDELGDEYTSLLGFVVLTAPLGGPPYFYVEALAGGAGYNRRLLVPTEPEGVAAFPLVQAMNADLGSTPLRALERLGEAMPPRRGSLWIAAGLRFTTFSVLRTVAVAHAVLDRGLEVGLLGLSSASLPSAGKELASLELALAARYRDVDRVLSVRAQLTDNSWLLSRDCQLTGGFALVMWFAEDRAVLTIGGYHPDFTIPRGFPRVPRVGFHWAVSEGIVVKGTAYLAITTSATMAGGRLEISYHRDPVRLWFRTDLDVLVRYKPFWFTVDASITVGAAFHYKVCFIKCATIDVGVEVGARLLLEGPPLRGRVTVDLPIGSVSVPFGPDTLPPTHQSWEEFVREYLIAEGVDAATRAQVTAGAGAGDAVAEAPDGTDEERPLRVLPEFTLLTQGTLPCVDARFGDRPPQSADVPAGFLIAPTGNDTRIAARHSVSVERRVGNVGHEVEVSPELLVAEVVTGGVSEAVFLPSSRALDDEVRPNAPLVPAVTGMRITARSAVRTEEPLPPVPVAAIVADADPLPLPLTGEQDPMPASGPTEPMAAPAMPDTLEASAPAPEPGPPEPVLRAVRGQTQIWQLPGARWSFSLADAAPARVVCLNGTGCVLADREGTWSEAGVDLPEDTVRLVLSGPSGADGPGEARPAEGWQTHSRLLQVAPSTLLAPGAVVLLPMPWSTPGPHATVGASQLARALPGLATQLSSATETLIVQLDRRAADTGLDTVAVTVDGLVVTAPERVDSGDRVSLVYGVEETRARDGRGTVTVAAGEGWTPAGVVGVSGEPDGWAAELRRAPRRTLVEDSVPAAPATSVVSLTAAEVS